MTTQVEGVSIEDRMGALFAGPQATEEAPAPEPDEEAPVEEEVVDEEFTDEVEDETVEEGEEAPEDSPQPGFAPISGIADGVEFTVETEDEARRLIQFGKTFTQRNQKLIEERKELEPMKLQLAQAREQYAAALPRVQQMLQSAIGAEPTPDQYQDRNEYLWAKDQWNQAAASLQALQAEQQRVQAEAQAEQNQRLQAWREAEAEALASQLPEWANTETAKAEIGRMNEYGQLRGLTPQELGAIHDHRFVMILRDAMRFHELEASGKTKAKQAKAKVKTAKPAASGPQQMRGRSVKKQRERLRQTGREQDAVPLMERALGLTK